MPDAMPVGADKPEQMVIAAVVAGAAVASLAGLPAGLNDFPVFVGGYRELNEGICCHPPRTWLG